MGGPSVRGDPEFSGSRRSLECWLPGGFPVNRQEAQICYLELECPCESIAAPVGRWIALAQALDQANRARVGYFMI